jgi:hypothetical protein
VFLNQQIARNDNEVRCKIGVKITILQFPREREFKGRCIEIEGEMNGVRSARCG